jgi:hypothetical protein
MPEKPTLHTNWAVVPDGKRLARQLGVPTGRLTLSRSGLVVAGQVWLVVPIDREWMAASRLAVQDGQLVVAEVRVFPRENRKKAVPGRWSADVLGTKAPVPRGGVTARVLRRVRVAEHSKRTQEVVDSLVKDSGPWLFEPDRSLGALGLMPSDQARPRPARKAGRPDQFYAKLAADYVQRIQGGARHPIKAMAGRRRVRAQTMRDWIHEARARGLLTAGAQGRAGGQLTPLADRVLKS